MSPKGRRTIHYTQLPDLPPDDEQYHEWNTYRRELPRLLAEGHEGKFALIRGQDIIGVYDSFDEGHRAGLQRYLGQTFAVQPILEQEPLLLLPWSWCPCHTRPSQ